MSDRSICSGQKISQLNVKETALINGYKHSIGSVIDLCKDTGRIRDRTTKTIGVCENRKDHLVSGVKHKSNDCVTLHYWSKYSLSSSSSFSSSSSSFSSSSSSPSSSSSSSSSYCRCRVPLGSFRDIALHNFLWFVALYTYWFWYIS